VSKKAWIIFAVIVVVVLGGLVAYSRSMNPAIDVSNVDANTIQAASDQNGQIAEHVLGATDAKVTVVEYGDYQCPYCGQVYEPLKSVTDKYGDSIAFVFRNFPLTNNHPNAKAAAAVAEAAGLQDKYWEMHDLLYTNQDLWQGLNGTERTETFRDYATQLKLNLNDFDGALANGASAANKKIAYDVAVAKKIGVNSTPTIFVNGVKISDDVSAKLQQGNTEPLEALIDAALKDAGVEVPAKDNK